MRKNSPKKAYTQHKFNGNVREFGRVCLRFYPYPEPKRAGVSFVGLSKSGRLHPASPHRQDTCPAPRRGQRRGRLSAYAVLPYIFPEYADCQKTLVGASIARPCPFACEKTYPEKALLRQVRGRPMVAPTYSIGHECDFSTRRSMSRS